MWITVRGGARMELPEGSTANDLAYMLNLKGAEEALGVSLNGKAVDLSTELTEGSELFFCSFEEPKGKEIFWHTSAHVLAQAILRLFPQALPTIGPPIDAGFYYDFANLSISESDFEKIEEEVRAILKANYRPERSLIASKEEALCLFADNPYKCELIKGFPCDEPLTAYRQGEFLDLCRGPHLANLGKIKAFKIMKTAGAYWRGDATKEMLTRVYAISFPNSRLLKDYLQQLEEAKKRDHKVLGPKLGLFSLKEEAPGMPFIHPKGMVVWNHLLDYLRSCLQRAGYIEIKTPTMMTRELWELSGHWKNYRQSMFTSQVEERDFAIKPMNCPGCMLYYRSETHSYRELPLRIAEVGNVHRFEPSGALSGLMRVRSFHQDDAHLFMEPHQIEQEITALLLLADEIYSTFGLQYHLELSTRPEKNTIGTDDEWRQATDALKNALDKSNRSYRINEGDGAFYGPKIDFHIRDAINRTWQCGTVQLDMALPERFELVYTAADGSRKRPVMIHRAIFGSIERFFGILIEHFAGRFPLWMSPIPARVIAVADRHVAYAQQVVAEMRKSGFCCDIDDSNESVGKKVRNGQIDQVNYILTVGDREVEEQKVSVRTRDNVVHGLAPLSSLLQAMERERSSRSLTALFHQTVSTA